MTVQLLEGVVLLISLVVVSNVINHYFSAIPTSLIQIGLGLVLALTFSITIPLKTDWFLLLFVAPLLYNDGRTFPKQDLWSLKRPIIINSIVLVFFTTFVGGAIIHLLIPSLPYAASFALAAILSPTDPVAVHSITSQAKLPKWIVNLVAGESLINDASGLIGFKYGVAATMTGVFSLFEAAGDFVYISVVGALTGFIAISLIRYALRSLIRRGFNDVTILAVINFITPFLIYLIAEYLHASGVIAVVVAGIFTALRGRNYLESGSEYVVVTNKSWEIIVYILNGMIFLILGIELPVAMNQAIQNPDIHTGYAVALVFAIWFILFLIRVLWIYGSNFVQFVFQKSQGKREQVTLSDALLSGLTGVRGAITMAAALSIPPLLNNEQPFPNRPLILFIAAGVIVLSLVMAVVLIPILTKRAFKLQLKQTLDETVEENVAPADSMSEKEAKNYLYNSAVQAVEEQRRQNENQRAALDVIDEYQKLIASLMHEEFGTESDQAQVLLKDELTLRRVGFRGEASTLEYLMYNGQITQKVYLELRKELADAFDALTNLHQGREVKRLKRMSYHLKHSRGILRKQFQSMFKLRAKQNPEKAFASKEMAKNALKFLSDFLSDDKQKEHQYNQRVVYRLVVAYRRKIAQLKANEHEQNSNYDAQVYQLRIVAFAAQRAAISNLVDARKLAPTLADKLRQEVNFAESALQLTVDTTE
ncbi:hypothetical protein FC62_GL000440 [Amylolactobacillus amylotrophicus DSM 20534]|uniref:Uncharacterized protein n=3 Tax=Amylolactobacillus TaxID=2767876 RepID=A0A0R1YJF1_9LACO|nr:MULTISPECIES: Na+/H+ antiporter [Amylolactobacillus]APT18989.1 Na+/H+ antiporter [Amylolactobacillus amylophilus DSM 20533 = JCM 1125]KRK38749.1 hypothetical protein FC62_GL000440 [Amylolactobacillus amylotrophicus DSM 20534]KRM42608.1 hypothetical protein FD40_GL000400 [Amylolactobacillus amylophilus DSM 20533 = JCM 1125]GED79969.1 sodium:proton antiporter [Amylolactobacillus amylophilus]